MVSSTVGKATTIVSRMNHNLGAEGQPHQEKPYHVDVVGVTIGGKFLSPKPTKAGSSSNWKAKVNTNKAVVSLRGLQGMDSFLLSLVVRPIGICDPVAPIPLNPVYRSVTSFIHRPQSAYPHTEEGQENKKTQSGPCWAASRLSPGEPLIRITSHQMLGPSSFISISKYPFYF